MERCAFCKSTNVKIVDEHYVYCSACKAIYTDMYVIEKNCDHIGKTAITALRSPDQQNTKEAIVYITENWKCSVCGRNALSDGW